MGNKQSIEWHQRCQNNVKLSIDKDRIKFIEFAKELEDDEKRYEIRELQIKEAIRQGKDGFDAEKFMKKRDASVEDSE